MTESIPQVQRFMTNTPLTINVELDLLHAKKLMQEHRIRHLPVLEHGKIVGIISEKDIDFIQTFKSIDLKKEIIRNAMTSDPYIVETSAQLDDVCEYMARNKFGCVLVQNNKKLVGIFTWIDALNAMRNVLHTKVSH